MTPWPEGTEARWQAALAAEAARPHASLVASATSYASMAPAPALPQPAATEPIEPVLGLPSACPVCGAYSLAPDTDRSALLAVCDVLVVKALEQMGKWIVRQSRERFRVKGTRPWHVAHTIWPVEDEIVTKALRGAWDVVPAMLDTHGCCGITSRQVSVMLDEYVHDLVVTGTAHTIDELRYRFEARLGLPVYDRTPSQPATV